MPSVSLAPVSDSASIAHSLPQSQQQPQQRQPVVSRTRSQGHSGQPPFTPPSSTSSSSSSSYPSSQRSGVAIGVPALHPHHARPPSQLGYSLGASSHFNQPFASSTSPSPSFSQPFSGFSRGSVPFAEQSSGSIAPSPSFSQPFSGIMPRSSAGMPELQPNSNAQFKTPVSGVQTIGMIGSLSSASRIRASGIQHQPRLGQAIDKSIPQSGINQALNLQLQKFPNSGLSNPSSTPSLNAPISAPQSAQSLQQQWMSNQGKQIHGTSFPSSSFRPQTKQHISQQSQQSPQQQQQQNSPPMTPNQLQVLSSQQQQQQKQLQQQQQNISMPHHLPDLHSNRNQQSLPQHLHSSRGHTSVTQRSNNQIGQSGTTIPITEGSPETGNQILSKRSIQELVAQIDPSEKLEPEVEDVLAEIANDFVESITTAACSLAKHRRSTTLEAKDILLYVERNWNMALPGFSGDEVKLYKKPYVNDIHKERLAMVRKSMGVGSDMGSTKSVGASGQIAANSKAHSGKASAPAPASPKGT
ncbi:hypothetical protein KSP39_PZI004733 [Platanthera zijinensis]|uniref:Transcription initiation factor TFIID subunit 12 domain-containing protein n=1 Tax=Platanthera zijinensis TaxID=2320716 RepID=A0AAP0GCE6_9ASPA